MLLGVRSSFFIRLFVILPGHLSSEVERVEVCSGNCIMNEILKKCEQEEQEKFPFDSSSRNLFLLSLHSRTRSETFLLSFFARRMFLPCASREPYLARGYPIRIRIIVDGENNGARRRQISHTATLKAQRHKRNGRKGNKKRNKVSRK